MALIFVVDFSMLACLNDLAEGCGLHVCVVRTLERRGNTPAIFRIQGRALVCSERNLAVGGHSCYLPIEAPSRE